MNLPVASYRVSEGKPLLQKTSCLTLQQAAGNNQVYLLKTFVERDCFRGICYQAANWIYVGQTKGRSRNNRYATLKVPIKDIYLYPLTERFRETLTHEA